MTSTPSPPGSPPSASKRSRRAEPARAAAALALAAAAVPAAAQQDPAPPQRVVVTGSVAGVRAFDAPYAVDLVDADTLRSAGPLVNLSEAMARVPGLVVNMRNNYAQDLQINSRGFGARATFGVRGIRLYTDGIPASMPDGQGQVSHFDLAGAQRIEVLRGPFSVLYGNSSGGVISLFTAPPAERAFMLDGDVGTDGLRQGRVGVEAPLGGGWHVRAQASRFDTDGARAQSAATRELANARLGWQGERDEFTLLASSIDVDAQDPLGLTRDQYDQDPTQTAPQATTFDTRKTIAQRQAGARWVHRFDGLRPLQSAAVTAYAGTRAVVQWLSIPQPPQANPTHPGGVVDFDRDYRGLDARATLRWSSIAMVVGASREEQEEDRRGFENFVGSTLGVTGALRRDEANRSDTTDVYAQLEAELTPALAATAGVRRGEFRVRVNDHYLSNGDDSDALRYTYTTPAAGLRWRVSEVLNLYASAGRGFESPTLNELAYRPDGSLGFNTELEPQRSRQVELGAKWARGDSGAEIAVFRADTEDEIGVFANVGGRSSFQNVGRTRREGVEIGARTAFGERFRARAALTWLDARYRDGAAAGRRIAGTIDRSAFAELAWRLDARTELAAEARAQGRVPVNDLNADFAAGFGLLALRATHRIALPLGTLDLLARVDNLADRTHVGSVIVNEGNSRFFEPGAGRTWLLSARWRLPW
jgi:iron complex outermembrane receptor protein